MDWNSVEANKPQESEPFRPKDSILPKLVIAGCGCLILIGILFAFFAGKVFVGVTDPPRTVKEHIKALNDGDFNLAYGYFTVEYRRKHSFGVFKSEFDLFSESLPIAETSLNRVNIKNDKATVEGMLTGRNGVVFPVRYLLIREKREWKIEDFSWEPPGEQQTI